MSDMKRRDLIILLIGATIGAEALPHFVLAQSHKGRRVALLSASSRGNDNWRPFRKALHDLGYGEGDLAFEERWAEGHNARLADLAQELVQLTPVVIVTASSAAALAAKRATSTIPIVTTFTADPIGAGLTGSLARPDGNVTGMSNIYEDTAGKELEMLKLAAPRVARVAVLVNPANPSHANELRGALEAARALQVELIETRCQTPEEVEEALARALKAGADSLLILADPLSSLEAKRIATFATSHRLPAVYGLRLHVVAGGLMSYGPERARCSLR